MAVTLRGFRGYDYVLVCKSKVELIWPMLPGDALEGDEKSITRYAIVLAEWVQILPDGTF